MLPSNNIEFIQQLTTKRQPSKTYFMTDNGRIKGYTDGIQAVEQAVYKILSTERYDYIIYSFNYGIQLKDLYGMPYDFCCAELERRIREALTWDDRIEDVDEFSFEKVYDSIHVMFTVHSIFGNIEMEEDINV